MLDTSLSERKRRNGSRFKADTISRPMWKIVSTSPATDKRGNMVCYNQHWMARRKKESYKTDQLQAYSWGHVSPGAEMNRVHWTQRKFRWKQHRMRSFRCTINQADNKQMIFHSIPYSFIIWKCAILSRNTITQSHHKYALLLTIKSPPMQLFGDGQSF